ncbi:MAG: hypothetical protein KC561_07920 [Myxococcales bacterium]|nr:hypothetical protein [Myxococcales bacterium]
MAANNELDRLLGALAESPEDPYLLLNAAAHLRRADRIGESSILYLRCHRVYSRQGATKKADAVLHQLLRFDPEHALALALLNRHD